MWWRCVKGVRSARKFLFYVVVGAGVFAAAPVWAQLTKDVLTTQIEALGTALGKPKVIFDDRELARIATLGSKALDPTLAAKKWADDLTILLTAHKPNLLDENLRRSIRHLLVALAQFRISERPAPPAPDPSADVDDQIVALAEVLDKLRPPGIPASALIDDAALLKLTNAIATKLLDPTTAVSVWAYDLAVILVDRKPMVADLKLALKKLEEALPEVEVKKGPYLNIVQAWFGDFHNVRRAVRGQLRINPVTGTGPRVCDATNEIRSACQGKSTCPFETNGLVPNGFCGEPPAPHASGDILGVGIEFQCLRATQQRWDELEHAWRIEPDQSAPTRMIMVRAGTSVTIRCTAALGNFEASEQSDKK